MTSPLPGPLKSADIHRFALRASQLEKVKPAIAYWCDYYIIQKILQKGLHTESDECMTYTTNLMDKLERWKADNADNDAIHDDMAAQAYVEQFALETFERAEKAVRANQVKAQTADTYQAAATFLDLLNIWQNPLQQDIAAKSKYAKFHALRIAKALKAGEDPNLSNPVRDEDTTPAEPPLDPDDPEVKRIQSLQPTVEAGGGTSQLPHPPGQGQDLPSFAPAPPAEPQPTAPSQADVSPLDPPPKQDGYFPTVSPPSLPTFTADTMPGVSGPVDQIMPSTQTAPLVSPTDYYTTSPLPQPPQVPSGIHPPVPPPSEPRAPSHPQLPSPHIPTPQTRTPAPFSPPPAPQVSYQQPQPYGHGQAQAPPQQPFVAGSYRRDDEAVLAAQKHAKWAISALNFEDVDTAVKELKIALQSLGAS